HTRHIPEMAIHRNANGVSIFQQSAISWSARKRGNVQRIHICIPTISKVLDNVQKTPHANPVVHSASFTTPILGKGVFQPPRNTTTPIIATRNIIAYSARKIKAKRRPPYSVWKPPTSSDSASGISNGARLHSA